MRMLISCGYLCACMLLAGVSLMAQDETTGMVGLSNNQAARLNVLNVAPASNATAAVCPAQLQIIDAGGGVLRQASVGIPSGKAAAIELRREDVTNASMPRIQVRGEVNSVAAPSGTTPVCSFVTTLEIIDEATGNTQVVLGGGHTIPAAPAGN